MFRFPPKHIESRGVRQVGGGGCSGVDFCLYLGKCCCRRLVCVGGSGAMAAGAQTLLQRLLLRPQWLGCTLVPGLHIHGFFVTGAGWSGCISSHYHTPFLLLCRHAQTHMCTHAPSLHSYTECFVVFLFKTHLHGEVPFSQFLSSLRVS